MKQSDRDHMQGAPILDNKDPEAPSVFVPDALLREARRQRGLPSIPVPAICLLDPDGDIVRHLRKAGLAKPFSPWACYHTELDTVSLAEQEVGIVGRVVGASFAVLVAEELFASGCAVLISLTSSGQITPTRAPPYFIVINRALRDEGTSYHYAAPAAFAEADPELIALAAAALSHEEPPVIVGSTWTTDAPFRETAGAIESAKTKGVLAVEMEASALYAFAKARARSVLCLAHVTNLMGQPGTDFEKGEADGTHDALRVLTRLIGALRSKLA